MHIKERVRVNTFHKEGKVGRVYYAQWNGKGGNKRKKLENKLRPGVSTPFNVNLWPFRQRYKVKIIRERRATAIPAEPLLLFCSVSISYYEKSEKKEMWVAVDTQYMPMCGQTKGLETLDMEIEK